MKRILSESSIETVCESSLCPNLNECFSQKRATFLILGGTCTRRCGFCSVKKGNPDVVDYNEPARISAIVKKLDLKYVVITSVTRDDLSDGGASHFAKVIESVKSSAGGIKVEVLVPDFRGLEDSIAEVVRTGPDVFGHNIETVKRLYSVARDGSCYDRSLKVLKDAKIINSRQLTKSGMMLGLGEKKEEVIASMEDLRKVACDLLTIGQYLKPRKDNLDVKRFIPPEEFEMYKDIAERLGFKYVSAGPFVRSSYFAEELYEKIEGQFDERSYSAVLS